MPASGVLSSDSQLAVCPVASAVQFWQTETGRPLGTLALLRNGQPLAISPDGHYRGGPRVEREVVYVVQNRDGQETLSPEEFAKRFGWKNDPERARLLEEN